MFYYISYITFFIFIPFSFSASSSTNNFYCQIQRCVIETNEKIVDPSLACDSNFDGVFILTIYQNNRLLLDSSIDFTNSSCKLDSIILVNFEGFNLNSNIVLNKTSSLDIFSSDFYFYRNWSDYSSKNSSFFSNVDYTLRFENNINYPSSISHLLFKGSNINDLQFSDLSNTKLKRNYFTFEKNFESQNLNSNINNLELALFMVNLSNDILDENVFENTKSITINNFVASIDIETFKPFKKLKEIYFSVYSLKELFNQNTKWMMYLNNNVKIDLTSKVQILDESQKMTIEFREFSFLKFRIDHYLYPDEDLCLFRYFPHENYVFPYLIECSDSCTYLWLVQYVANFESSVLKCNVTKACNFSDLFSKCKIPNQIGNNSDNNFDHYYLYDEFFKYKAYEFLISIVIFPFLCTSGIVLNLLSILVLTNKTYKKQMQEKMFKQMLAVCVINLLVCTIYLLRLTYKCIDPIQSYCVAIIVFNKTKRYILLTFTNYLGNIFKTCSNSFQILIVLDRYVLSTGNKSRVLNKIAQLKTKNFFLISFVLSSVLNAIKIFEFNYEIDYINRLKFPFLSANYFNFKYAFSYLNLLNIVLCNFFVLFLQLYFDLKLLIYVKTVMKNKMKLLGTQHEMKSKNNHPNKLANDFGSFSESKAEKKIKLMILTNGFFLFVIHMPDLIISLCSLSMFGHNGELSGSEMVNPKVLHLFSFLYEEISDCIYIFGYSTHFFFYFYYNKLFKILFKNLFQIIKIFD